MSKAHDKDDFGVELLAVAPHPDDAEIFCGGMLLKAADLGYRTAICDLTRGERGTGGNAELRQEEAKKATALLGLSRRENLGLPDSALNPFAGVGVEQEQGSQLLEIIRMLRRLRPEILLIPYCDDRHPDHRAASELLSRALFHAALEKFPGAEDLPLFNPRQVLSYQLRVEFSPSFLVDVSLVYEQKLKAVSCYTSQFELKNETLLGSPLSISSIQARDQYYGAMIGVRFAEAFLSRNALAIQDPLRHFRDNPVKRSYIYPRQP